LGSEVLSGIPAGNIFMPQDTNFAGIKEKLGILSERGPGAVEEVPYRKYG
jgi:hypothetical protein